MTLYRTPVGTFATKEEAQAALAAAGIKADIEILPILRASVTHEDDCKFSHGAVTVY